MNHSWSSLAALPLTMRWWRIPILVVVLAGVWAAVLGVAAAEDRAEDRATADRATLDVVYNPFALYSRAGDAAEGGEGSGGVDSAAEPTGYAIDILKALAAELGLTLRFHRAANPGEALQAIAAGEGDVHPHLSPSAERRATVQFTDPIDTIRIALYTRAARPGQARLDDLSGMRLGFTAGSINAQVARDFPEAIHVPYADSERLFFALARGDIDAALYPSRAFRELSRLLGTAGHYTAIGAPVREIPLALAVSNRRPALRDELDRALRSLRASPAFA
ncbi:MAG: transporter substrate-binding domain-containing protein, partial [Pseudomonadota bacterium]